MFSRFLFELMIKSMCEHLARGSVNPATPRRHRFSPHFCDDLSKLITSVTNDIIAAVSRDAATNITVSGTQSQSLAHHHGQWHTITVSGTPSRSVAHHRSQCHTNAVGGTPSRSVAHHHCQWHTITVSGTPSL